MTTTNTTYLGYQVLPCNFDWANIPEWYAHTVWVIRTDFDLNSIVAVIPEGVTLMFEGGCLTNGTITGNHTAIDAPLETIFTTSVSLSGTFIYDTFYPEWFGAKGDLSADASEAMKATFLNADHVTLTQKYLVTTQDRIVVQRDGSFTLIGYGSLVTNTTSTHMDQEMFVFKELDQLTIKGINIDGDKHMSNAIWINDVTDVTLNDITITNLLYSSSSPRVVGIRIDIVRGSVIYGNNVRISELGGGQNLTIGDPLGVARAIYCNVNYSPQTISTAPFNTKMTFDNSYFEWIYGDDGDVIDIFDSNYISDAPHRFIFNHCTIRYASRRLVKGSASGIQYFNCKFDTASKAELTAKMEGTEPQPSGGVNFRNADVSAFPDFRNMHGKMINCEYRNTGNLSIGIANNLIIDHTDGVEIRGNQFYDSVIRSQNTVANVKIDGNTFENSHIEMSVEKWESGRSYVTNNLGNFPAPVTPLHPALINSTNNLAALTIRNNRVFSDETGDPNFFALIRHVTGGEGVDVHVSNNDIVRTNTSRNELFISTRNWNDCKVFDNNNNRIGVGAGFNFTTASGASFSGASWNNRDGNGDLTN